MLSTKKLMARQSRRPPRSIIERHVSDLLQHAREELLRFCQPNSCLESTRLAVEYLRARGLRAAPLVVSVTAWNAQMFGNLRANPHAGPDDLLRWEHADGSWSLGVGVSDEALERAKDDPMITVPAGEGFNGHLVAVVEGRTVVDLSLDQLTRAQRDIVLTPTSFEPPREWFSGQAHWVKPVNGSWVGYEAVPSNRTFLTLPGWQRVDLIRPILAAVDRRMASAA